VAVPRKNWRPLPTAPLGSPLRISASEPRAPVSGTLQHSSTSASFDVVVAGGGPAGSATALDLSRRGFRVTLIEKSAYENFRVGETLPPEIRRLLTELGVWERFMACDRIESHGIRTAWETPIARHHDFLYNPYGCGWHVERAGFDAMLAGAAADAGAELIVSARITALDEDVNGQWLLEVAAGGKQRTLHGRLLVDATGRKASIARKLGCGVQAVDRLVGAVAVLPRSEAEHWTLIEAVENGWWYSAPLPRDGTVFAYMTDSDLWRNSSSWGELLRQAPLTSERATAMEKLPRIHIVSAASLLRLPVTGPNWIAAGDAALAFDPLSGLGIYKTIESGLRSSAAIVCCFEGDRSGMVEYENWTAETFRSYLSMRRQFYGSVERWPRSGFWQRRIEGLKKTLATNKHGATKRL
jgi:flavin-dependent dehydrogenase